MILSREDLIKNIEIMEKLDDEVVDRFIEVAKQKNKYLVDNYDKEFCQIHYIECEDSDIYWSIEYDIESILIHSELSWGGSIETDAYEFTFDELYDENDWMNQFIIKMDNLYDDYLDAQRKREKLNEERERALYQQLKSKYD